MKKISFSFLVLVFTLLLTSCGNKNSIYFSKDGKALTKEDLSIEDFKITANKSKCDDDECMVVNFTNKSKYYIIEFDIRYKVKDSVTNEELIKEYSEFIANNKSYKIDSDPKKLSLLNNDVLGKEKLVTKNETFRNIKLNKAYLGRYSQKEYVKEKEFNLMEPERMILKLIGEDAKLYTVHYSFKDKKFSLFASKYIPLVNSWSNEEFIKNITLPKEKFHTVIEDSKSRFRIHSYEVTKASKDEYIRKLKNSGVVFKNTYTKEYYGRKTDYFVGETKEGHKIYITYNQNISRMELAISKKI